MQGELRLLPPREGVTTRREFRFRLRNAHRIEQIQVCDCVWPCVGVVRLLLWDLTRRNENLLLKFYLR